MTSKLDEIAAALAEYDANVEQWKNDNLMKQRALRDLGNEMLPDALRLLVDVATAARELEPILNAGAIEYIDKEDSKALDRLLKALKALEE